MQDRGPHVLGRDLTETPLAIILITALKQKVTGELVVRHKTGEDRVYFEAGVTTGTQVLHAFKSLGTVLLELGWIDLPALEKSLEAVAQGRRQGEALVEAGAIDRAKLDEGLKFLQVRNLVEIARLNEGTLEFQADKQPAPWVCGVPANPLKTLRVILTVDSSLVVCTKAFERVGGEQALVHVPGQLPAALERFELDAEELEAAKLLAAPKTLAAYWDANKLPRPRARALAAELAITGALVAVPVPVAAQPAAAAPPPPAPAAAPPTPRTPLAASSPPAAANPPPGPSSPAAPAAAGPPAAAAAAPAPGQRNRSLEEDRARRRRLMQRGAGNLPGERPSRPPGAISAAAPSAAAAQAEQEKAFGLQILERARLLPKEDFFARLGVARDAGADAIKAAFLKSVQTYHPDHLPPSLAALADKQREIFAAVKEAYETLGDEKLRREYLFKTEPPSPEKMAAAREEEARTAANRGDALMQKGDYPGAAKSYQAAFEASQNGDHLASALWSSVLDPARKHEKADATTKLAEAAAKYPKAVKPSYYLGLLARMEGRTDEAEKLFRAVLERNPKHLEAGQEVRLIEFRRKQAAAAAEAARANKK